MNDKATTNSKFSQLMPEYVPGMRDDEKTALDNMAKAQTEFESCRGYYEEIASRHKFFTDEAASAVDESRAVNEQIKNLLRTQAERPHKELISLRASMREALEMVENHLYLAEECSGALANAKILAEKAANKYRAAHSLAAELISDNMLDAAIGSANTLFMAMHARVAAFEERRPNSGERDWFEAGFDSLFDFVIADVRNRIVGLYQTLDKDYLMQALPVPFAVLFNIGDFGGGTPASFHKAAVLEKNYQETSAAA